MIMCAFSTTASCPAYMNIVYTRQHIYRSLILAKNYIIITTFIPNTIVNSMSMLSLWKQEAIERQVQIPDITPEFCIRYIMTDDDQGHHENIDSQVILIKNQFLSHKGIIKRNQKGKQTESQYENLKYTLSHTPIS